MCHPCPQQLLCFLFFSKLGSCTPPSSLSVSFISKNANNPFKAWESLFKRCSCTQPHWRVKKFHMQKWSQLLCIVRMNSSSNTHCYCKNTSGLVKFASIQCEISSDNHDDLMCITASEWVIKIHLKKQRGSDRHTFTFFIFDVIDFLQPHQWLRTSIWLSVIWAPQPKFELYLNLCSCQL